jgi:superfamily II DNA/RNA helicase
LPNVSDVYLRRTGRTARLGKNGLALLIIQEDEIEASRAMEKEIGVELSLRKKPAAESSEENIAIVGQQKFSKQNQTMTFLKNSE